MFFKVNTKYIAIHNNKKDLDWEGLKKLYHHHKKWGSCMTVSINSMVGQNITNCTRRVIGFIKEKQSFNTFAKILLISIKCKYNKKANRPAR